MSTTNLLYRFQQACKWTWKRSGDSKRTALINDRVLQNKNLDTLRQVDINFRCNCKQGSVVHKTIHMLPATSRSEPKNAVKFVGSTAL